MTRDEKIDLLVEMREYIMNKERNDHDRSWISLMTFEDWFPKMRTHTYGLHKRIVEWEAELLFDEKGE